jgi:hypothetical protein
MTGGNPGAVAMPNDQRGQVRRRSDQLVAETIRAHQVILELLQGKGGNLAGTLRRLQEMGLDLGRREEDRALGTTLSQGLESIAKRLLELGVIEQLPRRVRLTKILGKSNGRFAVGVERLGWEMDIPQLGQRYCLYLDDGRVFRTGEVAEHRDDHFRTGNSVYKIQVMDERSAASAGNGDHKTSSGRVESLPG